MHTRREFGKWALTGLSLAALPSSDLWGSRIDSTYKGVKLGIITGSLNPLPNTPGKDPIDTIIQECVELQVGYVEFVNTPIGAALQGRAGWRPSSRADYSRIHGLPRSATTVAADDYRWTYSATCARSSTTQVSRCFPMS